MNEAGSLPRPAETVHRDIGLDMLRSIAVWLVLFRHVEIPAGGWPAWAQPLSILKRGGWMGVDIFFVLSGFLISGLLFKEYQRKNSVSIGRFLIRRGFKLYPAFWVMIGCTVVVTVLFRLGELSLRGVIGEILFIQNYYRALWLHTWSLAVEEHFYLFLAMVVFFLIRKHRGAENPFRIIPTLFGVVATGCFILRWLTVASLPREDSWHAQFLTHLRIDSLFFGVLISYFIHFKAKENFQRRLRPKRPLLLVLGMLFCSLPFFFDYHTSPWMSVEGPTILFLGAGALLLAVTGANLSHNRLAVWSAAMGAYSYSVYLWHRPIQSWTQPIFDRYIGGIGGWLAGTTFYLIASWIVGILLSKLIEMPVLRIRDHLFPRNSNSLPAGGSPQKIHAAR